jgi:ABC-type transport system involved in multi-copper enzyme maturation permease subunit
MKAILFATINEMVRRKTFVVMGIVTTLYLIFWMVILYNYNNAMNAHGVDGAIQSLASTMLLQMGLQFSSMLICLLSIMLGAGMIATDLDSGLVLAIISRPIQRFAYVLGKLFGVMLLIMVFGSVLFFLILIIGAGYSLSSVSSLDAFSIIRGWLLYLAVPFTVLCLTLFGSVSLKAVPNGLLMIFIYILGNVGGMVEMIGEYINDAAVTSGGILISLISPFNTLYSTSERFLLPSTGIGGDMMRGMSGLSGGGEDPSMWMYVYIVVYALFFVFWGVRKFQKRDINV